MQAINESIAFDMLRNKTKLFGINEESLLTCSLYNKALYIKNESVKGLTYVETIEGQTKMALVLTSGSEVPIDKLNGLFTSESEAVSYLKQVAADNGYVFYTAGTNAEVPYLVLGKVEIDPERQGLVTLCNCACEE